MGIIVSGFMAAIIGLLKYIADPDTELQDIVYWQLGSLAKVTWDNLLYVLPIIITGTIAVLALRWRLIFCLFLIKRLKVWALMSIESD